MLVVVVLCLSGLLLITGASQFAHVAERHWRRGVELLGRLRPLGAYCGFGGPHL